MTGMTHDEYLLAQASPGCLVWLKAEREQGVILARRTLPSGVGQLLQWARPE